MDNTWIRVSDHKPPKGDLVETKVDKDGVVTNERKLRLRDNLWWTPDNVMYVYYTPTHWKKPTYSDKP